MATKLLFAAAAVGLVALVSGGFLDASPNHLAGRHHLANKLIPGKSVWTDVMRNMMAFDISDGMDVDADDLDAMEKTIEDLASKDDPASKIAVQQLSGFIVNVMIPNREKQQKADQDSLTLLAKDVEGCRFKERVKYTPAVAEQLKTVEEHKDDYAENIAKAGSCQDVLEGKELVKDAYCAPLKEEDVCKCDEKFVELFGHRNADCDSAPKISSEDEKCCAAYLAHEKKRADCMSAKADAKYASKQHSIIMGNLCDEYDKCYDDKSIAYKATEEQVVKREKTRSWASLYRIKCLVDRVKDAKGEKADTSSCKDQTEEASKKAAIEYPALPEKRDCNEDVQA